MEKYTTAGHVIRNYRQQAQNAGYNVDGYTDEEILRFLGDDLRNQGRTSEEIANTYGTDFSSRYLDVINAPERERRCTWWCKRVWRRVQEVRAKPTRKCICNRRNGSRCCGIRFC